MIEIIRDHITWTTYIIGAVLYGLPITLLSMWVYCKAELDSDFADNVSYKVLRALLWPLSILVLQDDETTPALEDFVDPYDHSDGMWMVYVVGGTIFWPLRAFLWVLSMVMFVVLRLFFHLIIQPILGLGKLLSRR